MTDPQAIFVYITIDTKENAERIARSLIAAKLAACANISSPITSIFRWNESITLDDEYVILAKTCPHLFTALSEHVKTIHPYEQPCIIGYPISHITPDFLQWIQQETS